MPNMRADKVRAKNIWPGGGHRSDSVPLDRGNRHLPRPRSTAQDYAESTVLRVRATPQRPHPEDRDQRPISIGGATETCSPAPAREPDSTQWLADATTRCRPTAWSNVRVSPTAVCD